MKLSGFITTGKGGIIFSILLDRDGASNGKDTLKQPVEVCRIG